LSVQKFINRSQQLWCFGDRLPGLGRLLAIGDEFAVWPHFGSEIRPETIIKADHGATTCYRAWLLDQRGAGRFQTGAHVSFRSRRGLVEQFAGARVNVDPQAGAPGNSRGSRCCIVGRRYRCPGLVRERQ
jgi:hypothetical protein